MGETIGIGIFSGIIILALFIIFIKSNLVICQPNEVVIISGRKRKLADGTVLGYRLIKGGRGFKFPIIESVKRISLTTIPIEVRLTKALSKGMIPINVDGRANVKIAGSEKDGLSNAIERFLGRSMQEISVLARETIEGSLRGVLATVTPEDANAKRLEIADLVADQARVDLMKLGLVLDFVKIQNISDGQGYLDAIGRKKNAEVIKEAKIAEATADSEARAVTAEQKRKGRIAETQADIAIVEAENKLNVYRSELAIKSNAAEEKAKIAGEITRIAEQRKLEEERIAMNQKKYEAEVVIPAEATKKANELKAIGEAAKILEDGKATAEAIKLMQAQWADGKTRDLFLIQLLPKLMDKVTRVLADNLHIEKLTVLDSGAGNGIPTHIKNLTGSVVTMMEQLKNATGLDLPGLLNGVKNGDDITSLVPKELSS
ncbi:flotillin family protein [candidate division KSB1 bacterium]|nr:flotillin family protein [candidate division KSB1 bacterium]